jgi:hypothetical protein
MASIARTAYESRSCRPETPNRVILRDLQRWNAVAQAVSGVTAFMYTTWRNKYEDLEKYGRALQGGGQSPKK